MTTIEIMQTIENKRAEITSDLSRIMSWAKSDAQREKLDVSALDIMNTIASTALAIRDDIKNAPRVFHAGNGKIDKAVLCQSIIPVISCGCHCPGCYAVNCCVGYQGHNVIISWYRWFFIEKYMPELYFSKVRYELLHTKKRVVRLHESGDFISETDAAAWLEIIRDFPNIRFYTYTKQQFSAVQEMRALANCNIVNSLPCKKLNYGTSAYIAALASEIIASGAECHICACGTAAEKAYNKAHAKTDGKKYCGGACQACAYCENVLFYEHK